MTISVNNSSIALDPSEKVGTISHRRPGGGPRGDEPHRHEISRYVHAQDETDALSVCKHAHENTAYASAVFDSDRVRMHGKLVQDKPHMYGGIVAKVSDEVVGLIFGYRSYSFINITSVAADYVIYVLPEHRSVALFNGLIDEFERWAAEDEWTTTVILGVTEMDRCTSVHRLFRQRGYKLKTRLFAKELVR